MLKGSAIVLYPQQNDVRNVLDLSGFWRFKLDPDEVGEGQRWFDGLQDPRTIAVPASWNELFRDTRDYLDMAWYAREFYVPQGWQGQRITLRVGSANYFDFFPYTGIHRPVLLYSAPKTRIEDVTVVTEIDGGDGIVKVQVAQTGSLGAGKIVLTGEGTTVEQAGSAPPSRHRDGARGGDLV
jgi:beta-galactosidase/beta-glucuronidase